MTPSKEMFEAFFDELAHVDKETERLWFFAGVAAYTHLQSPGSEEWRVKHGFKTEEHGVIINHNNNGQ